MNKLRQFKCHICGTIILTDCNTSKCDNCKNEYVLKNGKYYRKTWITRSYKRFRD